MIPGTTKATTMIGTYIIQQWAYFLLFVLVIVVPQLSSIITTSSTSSISTTGITTGTVAIRVPAVAAATETSSPTNTIINTAVCDDESLMEDGTCINVESKESDSSGTNSHNSNNDNYRSHSLPSDCGIYIAKSTIPGAGLGIFNGNIEKKAGDVIQSKNGGDICIPFIDMIWHNYNTWDKYRTTTRTGLEFGTSPLTNYYWAGFVMGMHEESIFHDECGVEAFCTGFDTIINAHMGLRHLLGTSVPQYDDLSVPKASSSSSLSPLNHDNSANLERYHRSTHPGVGAFTPYFNGTTVVKSGTIQPYAELFKDYGDHWFLGRAETLGNIPVSTDYNDIQVILHRFASLNVVQRVVPPYMQNNTPSRSNHDGDVKFEAIIDLYETLLQSIKNIHDSRTLNALPSKLRDAIFVATGSPSSDGSGSDPMTTYLQNIHTTDLEYLQTYGTCIDQIKADRSTLSNAGHGAFATRSFAKGTIITASPLLIIPDEQILYMYNFTKYNNSRYRNYKKRKHYQLLYNYCHGHAESTLLLCPHGGGINYINHNQSLVNVKIEWTTNQLAFIHNATLVATGTINDMVSTTAGIDQQSSQLVFQYVATRDIQPNEELFLDYGDDWENAWQYHVKHFPYIAADNNNKNNARTPKYISAHEYNYYFHDALIRTIDEQMVEPYPNNLQLRCHRTLFMSRSIPLGIYEWKDADYGLSCRIVDRWIERSIVISSPNMELYTIQLQYVPSEYVTEQQYDQKQAHTSRNDDTEPTTDRSHRNAIWVTRTDVPRSAIHFFDVPYTTDLHLTSAFRHYISISDDIFPEQWKSYQ